MTYGRGLLRTTPHKVAHRLAATSHPAILYALRDTLPSEVQLQPCVRLDQGQTGSCHAHSLAGALWTAYAAHGKALPFVPSPRMIASCTYADVQGPADKRGPLQDTGAELQDDATAVATWGIAPMAGPSSDGRNSDVENDPADNTFPEPDTSQLVYGGRTLITGEYSIAIDSNAPNVVAASIAAGIPVWVGFYVDSAFESLGPNDVATVPNQADPNGGGHAVYLSGYRTVGSERQWRLENSWGTGWADGGAVWCSTAWLMANWDLWPMAVVR